MHGIHQNPATYEPRTSVRCIRPTLRCCCRVRNLSSIFRGVTAHETHHRPEASHLRTTTGPVTENLGGNRSFGPPPTRAEPRRGNRPDGVTHSHPSTPTTWMTPQRHPQQKDPTRLRHDECWVENREMLSRMVSPSCRSGGGERDAREPSARTD
jgi:hypothetical protein